MIRNFEYLIVFSSAPGVLPEQNERYRIQPWKVNEIKAYKKSVTTGIRIQDPSIENSAHPNYLNIGTGAKIPSSAYIHIENFITHYKSVLQFEILNIPKKEPQSSQANQTNVDYMKRKM